MNAFAALFICVAGALLVQTLQHAYFYLPKKELKRRPEPIYKKLQMVAKYGSTARGFLMLIKFCFGVAAVIIAARSYDPFVTLIMLAIFAGLLKIIESRKQSFGRKLAAKSAPYIAKLLYYVEPFVEGVKDITPGNRNHHRRTTEIYEAEDLQDFIKLQQRAPNNRIAHHELIAALNSIEFGGKRIKEHMIRREKVHFVNAKDPIGPILLSELHRTGFTCFPVQGNSENEVEGMLYLEDLVKHTEGGTVSSAMESKVVYVNENKLLEEVLHAFSKTGRHEFIVLNSEARITGLISLREVLEQMTGHSENTSFDDYDDPAAVASS